MNQITKKLLLSVLTVVLTVIALGTTTFAWFTLTNTATVQPFSAQVVADTGIEVQLDNPRPDDVDYFWDSNLWVNVLTTQMLNDYITAKYGTFFFNHLTSPNGIAMYALGQAIPTNLGYLEIGLRFRSNNAQNINITNMTLDSPLQSWQSDVAFENTTGAVLVGQSVSIRGANGVRVSIQGAGTVVDGPNLRLFERGGVSLGTPAAAAENTILGEVINGKIGMEFDTDAGMDMFVNTHNLLAGAIDYYNQKSQEYPEGNLNINIPATTTIPILNASPLGQPVLFMDGDTLDLGNFANSGFITIRIWLEGWDPDTFNAVLSTTIIASFVFKDPSTI